MDGSPTGGNRPLRGLKAQHRLDLQLEENRGDLTREEGSWAQPLARM